MSLPQSRWSCQFPALHAVFLGVGIFISTHAVAQSLDSTSTSANPALKQRPPVNTPQPASSESTPPVAVVYPDAPLPSSSLDPSRPDTNILESHHDLLPKPAAAQASGFQWKVLPGAHAAINPFALETRVRPRSPSAYVPLEDCPSDETRAPECRMHWGPMLIESILFNTFEDAGNIYTGYWYRWETTHGKWWDRYLASAAEWRWDRWSDDNPLLDDYVGHPMMGAITNSIWIQNDPKGMTLTFQNDRDYWHSRLRALAWSTFYSFEWKLGPTGEAAVGHNGDHFFFDKGVLTNETGWVELVTTPVGGFGWTITEDYLDKHLVTKLENKSHNPILLTMDNFLTPARGFANILRFRPPWYRDSRIVKASGFWSDPGEGVSATTAEAMRWASRHPGSGAESYLAGVAPAPASGAPNWQGPGGRHEIGAWWGFSAASGHLWGYSSDVKYMPVDLRYSYEFYRHHESWTLRYSPEITALAMIDWPTPNTTPSGTAYNQRTRAYGSGLSPVGFQWDFLPLHRVQPFISGDGGFLYFDKRVLSPQGSQFMYTLDYGAGLNIFHHKNQAITLGYRYQHLSNLNISHHNPGTDANTIYVGISRFRTKGDSRPQRDLR